MGRRAPRTEVEISRAERLEDAVREIEFFTGWTRIQIAKALRLTSAHLSEYMYRKVMVPEVVLDRAITLLKEKHREYKKPDGPLIFESAPRYVDLEDYLSIERSEEQLKEKYMELASVLTEALKKNKELEAEIKRLKGDA